MEWQTRWRIFCIEGQERHAYHRWECPGLEDQEGVAQDMIRHNRQVGYREGLC